MTSGIEISNISKSFGPVKVLEDISFDIRPSEVHALMGENGAGKSTLIRILAGLLRPDRGQISVDGISHPFKSPAAAVGIGIATVYQELLLFPELSITENVFSGNLLMRPNGLLDWPEMRRHTRELLDRLDARDIDVNQRVSSLSIANRQRVEIAKALSRTPRLLIMDEPTTALTDTDAENLLRLVRSLRDQGVSVLYVSHRMPEIFAIADRVTVIRDGRVIWTRNLAETGQAQIVDAMVGRSVDVLFPKKTVPIGGEVLRVVNLSCGRYVHSVNFSVRAGEIVGMAGLVGAGRTEIALTIFGVTPADSGTIHLCGREVSIRSPRHAKSAGIAYVPEDRAQHGLVREMDPRSETT